VFACLSHLGARVKLDLFAAALAQLLVGRVGALRRPDAAARRPYHS
jgi:hypothetical protein